MENDNNSSDGIGSASSVGDVTGNGNDLAGSVTEISGGGPTDALGGQDTQGVGISGGGKTAEGSADAGGKVDFGSPGSLDTDLQTASPTTAVIDSQHLDQPSQPSFIQPNMTTTDVSKLSQALGLAAVATAAVLTGAPSAFGLLVSVAGATTLSVDVIARATMDIQQWESPVLAWDQSNPSATGGGGGGG